MSFFIKRDRLSRTLTTAKLTMLLGRKVIKKLLNGEPLSPEDALKAMTKLASELDGMKGLLMKFGQIASYLGAQLPPQARAELEKLQSTSSAMPYDQVRALIEEEFDAFETEAFAAASIGQVHKAIYNGRYVAVKVQYPGIDRLVGLDLKLIGNLFLALFAATSMPGKALVKELTDRLLEECDYELEASRQICIRDRLLDNPSQYADGTYVPEVILSRTTKRVLTSELIDARPFQAFRDEPHQELKDLAGRRIFYHAFESIFGLCYFNGDPQPGNYLFGDNAQVIFIDFGCIKTFTLEFIHQWKNLAKSILEDDFSRFRSSTIDLGLVGNKNRFDFDFHYEMMKHIYTPYSSDLPFRYTHEFNKKTNEYLIWQNKNRLYARLPPDFLFINRLQWGLASVLADLNAEAVWSNMFKQVIYGDDRMLFESPET